MAWDFSRWASWRGVLVLVAAFLALYAQVVRFDYVFDDITEIRDNPAFELPLSEALRMSQHQHLRSVVGEARRPTHDSYRPLRHLSFYLDYLLFGKSAVAFHLHNVLSGAVVLCLVWSVLGWWCCSPQVRWGMTAVFAFHPVQIESVAYLSGRSDVEASIFALLAVHFGYRYLGSRSKGAHLKYGFAAALSFLVSLAYKESFVLLPLLLSYRPTALPKQNWKRYFFALLAAGGLSAGWFLLRSSMISGAAPFDLDSVLASSGRGLRQAFLLVALPLNTSPVRPLASGEPWVETVLYGLGCLALLVVAITTRKERVRAICLGLAWFVLLVGPSLAAASFFQVLSDHYLYLPLVGLLLALGGAADAALEWLRRTWPLSSERGQRAIVFVPLALWSVWCLSLTWRKIPGWKDTLSLARLAVAEHPEAARGWVWLADAQVGERGCEGVEGYYQKAAELEPDYAPAWNNLAVCALRRRDLLSAEQYAKKAIQFSNGTRLSAWYNYGLILEGLGKKESACRAQQGLLKLDPNYRGLQAALNRVCSTPPPPP